MEEKQQLKYRAYRFSIRLVKFVSELPNQRIFWVISDQLLKAETSIGANILEARSASLKRDFIGFNEIALKSANETKYWLGLLRDATKIDKATTGELLKEINEISKIIASSLLTIKKKKQF